MLLWCKVHIRTCMYALALVCTLLLCRVYTGIHCACSKTTVMVLPHRDISFSDKKLFRVGLVAMGMHGYHGAVQFIALLSH